IGMILVSLAFLAPFYFLLVNSVKPFGEIMSDAASWPQVFQLENYARAWKLARLPEAILNSFVITVIGVTLIALISCMAAYRMVRANTVFNQVFLLVLVAAMVVPFQTIMMPLIRVISELGLMNSK